MRGDLPRPQQCTWADVLEKGCRRQSTDGEQDDGGETEARSQGTTGRGWDRGRGGDDRGRSCSGRSDVGGHESLAGAGRQATSGRRDPRREGRRWGGFEGSARGGPETKTAERTQTGAAASWGGCEEAAGRGARSKKSSVGGARCGAAEASTGAGAGLAAKEIRRFGGGRGTAFALICVCQ